MIATFSDRALSMTTPRFFQSAAIYTDRRAISLFFLGFAAGLPFLLIFSSLSIWLNEAGVDRGTVTRFSWAALAYSCKFIWSPLVDTLPLPLLTRRLGRRRAWLAAAQCVVIAAICLMALINPADSEALSLMALAAVLLGFSAATQDIVIDAYRIDLHGGLPLRHDCFRCGGVAAGDLVRLDHAALRLRRLAGDLFLHGGGDGHRPRHDVDIA